MNFPLVSIVIPSYKARYLSEALVSALDQDYPNLEIVICDDCRDESVYEIVKVVSVSAKFEIRYFRNSEQLGEMGNLVRCIGEAKGTYIKFLYDDDMIFPQCVSRLVAVMESFPEVSIASSRRQLIGVDGERLPDQPYTRALFNKDVIIEGESLVSFLGVWRFNFIGEPSSVLCRRADLLELGRQLFALAGQSIDWVGDLAMYVKLLRKGNLALLYEHLSCFRVSPLQYSEQGRIDPRVGENSHVRFSGLIRLLDWSRCTGELDNVEFAELERDYKFQSVDLAERVKCAIREGVSDGVHTWLERRFPNAYEMEYIKAQISISKGVLISLVFRSQGSDFFALNESLRSLHELGGIIGIIDIVVISDQPRPPSKIIYQNVTWHCAEHVNCSRAHASVVRESRADWIMFLDSGDQFLEVGALSVALDLPAANHCQAIYGDELFRLEDGSLAALFRMGFNLDFLLSFPSGAARHWLFRRDVILDFFSDADSALDMELDLILRIIEHYGVGGIAHTADPLVIARDYSIKDSPAQRASILRHLAVRGYAADIKSYHPGQYHIDYRHSQRPKVSIIIPMRERLAFSKRCVESVLEKTTYPNYEILIVDNSSSSEETVAWLRGIESIGTDKLRVFSFSGSFNQSAMYNFAAQLAVGDYLVLLNNDTGALHGDWLDEMLNHALRPEVGIVGGRLLYPDGRIRHGGVVLGLHGAADLAFNGESQEAAGYMQRLQLDQNYSAVSSACMMIRASLYRELGGMDDGTFKVSFSDVDLCLRAKQSGYLTVWTPHVTFLHEGGLISDDSQPTESIASQRLAEQYEMFSRWLPELATDPAYNENLSLQGAGFILDDWNRKVWVPTEQLPRALCYAADLQGCGHYRIRQPLIAMHDAGLLQGGASEFLLQPAEFERFGADTVVFQRQVSAASQRVMTDISRFSQAFKVYELDDYLPNVPLKSEYRQHISKDILKSIRKSLTLVDRFVVSTEPLADALAGMCPDVRVIQNRLPPRWWNGVRSLRRQGRKPRVGWAGGISHSGDLELISDVVKDLANEVEWVFMGMCPDVWRPYVQEFHPGVSIERYPAKLASLNLDLALAPLEDNLFNRCKSNLRLLEYGICGFPVICSDIQPYRCDLPVTRVRNRYKEWVDAIRAHLQDLDATSAMGDALQARVRSEWMLKGENLLAWRNAWLPD